VLGWGVGYVMLVRCAGALLANVPIWARTVLYPVYRATDAARGLNRCQTERRGRDHDGGAGPPHHCAPRMAVLRLAVQEDQRQELLDVARDRGIELSEDRAARAAAAGAAQRLRNRLVTASSHSRGTDDQPGSSGNERCARTGNT
jgi:hypothetical protein